MPVVSTRHCDIPEVVVDRMTGYLSPERDVDALAANLERLINEPTRWESMGRAARAHVEEHDNVRTQVARLEIIYDALEVRTVRSGRRVE